VTPSRAPSGEQAAKKVRAYFAKLSPDIRRGLEALRDAIRAAAPRATESFGYGMPAFRLDDKPLVWYAAWKSHYSLYPIGEAILRDGVLDLARYETAKGTIRFPHDDPPSPALVKQLIAARIAAMDDDTAA
jgi:uncharacterized protein YdhG (YjbR/CyaY superfamily)